jgi:hypothetical protein
VDTVTFLRALWAGLKGFLRAAWLSLRQLFHQVTGVFFLLFATIGWAALLREWHRWPTYKLVVTGIFTAVFTLFTIESFIKARRLQ